MMTKDYRNTRYCNELIDLSQKKEAIKQKISGIALFSWEMREI